MQSTIRFTRRIMTLLLAVVMLFGTLITTADAANVSRGSAMAAVAIAASAAFRSNDVVMVFFISRVSL